MSGYAVTRGIAMKDKTGWIDKTGIITDGVGGG